MLRTKGNVLDLGNGSVLVHGAVTGTAYVLMSADLDDPPVTSPPRSPMPMEEASPPRSPMLYDSPPGSPVLYASPPRSPALSEAPPRIVSLRLRLHENEQKWYHESQGSFPTPFVLGGVTIPDWDTAEAISLVSPDLFSRSVLQQAFFLMDQHLQLPSMRRVTVPMLSVELRRNAGHRTEMYARKPRKNVDELQYVPRKPEDDEYALGDDDDFIVRSTNLKYAEQFYQPKAKSRSSTRASPWGFDLRFFEFFISWSQNRVALLPDATRVEAEEQSVEVGSVTERKINYPVRVYTAPTIVAGFTYALGFVGRELVAVYVWRDQKRQRVNMNGFIQCANCDKPVANPSQCGHCSDTYYCGDNCADAHWPEHSRE